MTDIPEPTSIRNLRIFRLQRKLLDDRELRADFNEEWKKVWNNGKSGIGMKDAIHQVRDKWIAEGRGL
jgi:hypothetical protein